MDYFKKFDRSRIGEESEKNRRRIGEEKSEIGKEKSEIGEEKSGTEKDEIKIN